MRTKRPGQIIGDEVIAHFSYFTQERVVLDTDILAGVSMGGYPGPRIEISTFFAEAVLESASE
jgi:hypothetical protein